ncbi:MAG: hypothetical protein J6A60_04545 [Clostridia bacterium]|nr:hypothetical protein [Clostridia bacterium]
MNKSEFKLNKLLYDNRFLMVFSVIAAIVIWAVSVVYLTPETDKTIDNVPVKIETSGLSESNNLKAYYDADYRVNVVVRGQRHIVDSVEEIKDDLVVYANTSFVSVPGTHTLKLDIDTNSANPQYEIISVSLEEIDVYFDTETQLEFKIEPLITGDDGVVADGYIQGDMVVSGTDKVTVSGPSGEVKAIKNVFAVASVDDPLTQSAVISAKLNALDEDGNNVKYIKLSRDENVQVNVNVSKEAELTTDVGFTNIPSLYLEGNYPFEYTVTPGVAKFAVDESNINEETGSIEIGKIDFSQIQAGENAIAVDSSEINGLAVLNGSSVFNVTVDASGLSQKTVDNIGVLKDKTAFIDAPAGKTVTVDQFNFESVTIVGPEESVSAYSADTVNLVVDLHDVEEESGTFEVPVRINDDDCWLYGEYTAVVTIS